MIYALTNGCETKKIKATVSVTDFLRDYVDIPRFLECCKACPNYNTRWSCPPYDFDAEALGGNVGRLAVELLGTPLCWGKPGEATEYYVMVGGLLLREA